MGVVYRSIDRQFADANNLSVRDGALVQRSAGGSATSPAVVPGSPADQVSQEGDIITKVNDQAIDGDHPLDATLSLYAPGDTVTLTILRDGQTTTVQLQLDASRELARVLLANDGRQGNLPTVVAISRPPRSSGPPSLTAGLRTRTPTSCTSNATSTSWLMASAIASSNRNEVDSTTCRAMS